jgi:hypothetical protein
MTLLWPTKKIASAVSARRAKKVKNLVALNGRRGMEENGKCWKRIGRLTSWTRRRLRGPGIYIKSLLLIRRRVGCPLPQQFLVMSHTTVSQFSVTVMLFALIVLRNITLAGAFIGITAIAQQEIYELKMVSACWLSVRVQ